MNVSSSLTRRDALKFAALGMASAAASLMLPAGALADEWVAIPITEGMTVGDLIAIADPDQWASLPQAVKDALLTAPVEGGGGGPQTRASVGGSAWVTPNSGAGSSFYECGYTTRVSCPGLAVHVTYISGSTIYYNKTFYGSGQNVQGSDTVRLPAGVYSVVATGYPTSVNSGYEVSYSQGFGTAYVS